MIRRREINKEECILDIKYKWQMPCYECSQTLPFNSNGRIIPVSKALCARDWEMEGIFKQVSRENMEWLKALLEKQR